MTNIETVRDDLNAQAWFETELGREPSVLVRAPGRVNLIGEHTDYNEGWVLPAAINLGTTVAARQREDRELRVFALLLDAEDQVSLDELKPATGAQWTRYVRGMAAILVKSGYDLPGADLAITGDLPLSAGLSSSASLEMAVGVALCELAGITIDPKEMAHLGRRVENEVLGVQTGLMDQLAVVCGRQDHALLIDCRTAGIKPVRIPPTAEILILDTGVPRRLSGSAYNLRQAECLSALVKLQALAPNLRSLRDVTVEVLAQQGNHLDDNELRRARHVIMEDVRVLAAAQALHNDDLAEFGRLMIESHASLRDDFEVSSTELDAMVESAVSQPEVFGARLTGAGFGGCVVALVTSQSSDGLSQLIIERYERATGRRGKAYVCKASDGAHVVSMAAFNT